jgi:NADPH:quinone reductase-like Zn-dependent oxidoreductase
MRSRRIVVPRYGGPQVMRVIEEPLPKPTAGQARVSVMVTEVNFTDVLLREGDELECRSWPTGASLHGEG